MTARVRSRLMIERGSILLGGLVAAAVLILVALALFDLTGVEARLVVGRASRTQALYTAEAGVQKAWYEMANGTNTFDSVYSGAAGMVIKSGTLSVKLGTNTSSVTYSVTKVDNPTTGSPTTPNCNTVQCIRVSSTGYGPKAVFYASGPQAVIQVVFSHDGPPTFQYGIFGKGNVTCSGGCVTDGWDPTVGCGSPPCPYSNSGPSKNTLTDGDVRSNANITRSGSGTINGDVVASGTVTGGNTNVYGGTVVQGAPTLSVTPDPVPPCSTLSSAGDFSVTGDATRVTYASGVLTVNGGATVNLHRGTTYCFNVLKVQGGGMLNVDGTVGQAVVYVNGDITVSGGNSIVNTSHDPTNLQVYSASTNKVTLSGGNDCYMTVFAPNAEVDLTGSGTSFYGAVVGDVVKVSASVHFDEALRKGENLSGGIPGWKQDFWSLVSNF